MSASPTLDEAVAALRAGELVVMPTETVYGLAADASNPSAVAKIYALKGRPVGHPLIVHLAHAGWLSDWAASVPVAAARLAAAFWPGPLTLILPKQAHVSENVTGGQASVGLRVPAHPVAQQLLQAFRGGIAAPSANRYGRVSPTSAGDVREEFGDRTPLLLDGGRCVLGLESTIVSFVGEPLLLRPGGVSRTSIEALIGPIRQAAQGEGPRASGTTLAHYSPGTPVRLVGAAIAEASADAGVAVLARRASPEGFRGVWCRAPEDAEAYGRELYATLRRLDHLGLREILVEEVPKDPRWDAVRDRLTRAAASCAVMQTS